MKLFHTALYSSLFLSLLNTALAENVTIVAAPSISTETASVNNSAPNRHKVIYYQFSVPAEQAQVKIAELLATGEYRAAAINVNVNNIPVSVQSIDNPRAPLYSAFNDPFYSEQTYFQTDEESSDGIGITNAQSFLVPYKPMEIGVIDGGFLDSLELVYVSNADTINQDDNAFETCSTPHGLGVASVIGATRNNSIGMAGMMDVDIVPVRALDCDGGDLLDVTEAIYYLSGAEVGALPIKEIPVSVINMSLGGTSECPFFVQEAIDFARNQGIAVVASAGNQARDAENVTPANCNGVVSVGALSNNDQGVSDEPAVFTNYGESVDISAKGDGIVGLLTEFTGAFYNGTSFSAPIVSAAMGMLKQINPDISPDEALWWLQFTSKPYSEASECQSLGCGFGALNVENAISSYSQHMLSSATIQSILLNERRCGKVEAYTLNNNLLPLMCERYEAALPQYSTSQNYTIILSSIDIDGEKSVVEEGVGGHINISGSVNEELDYVYEICLNHGSCSPEYPVAISSEKPAICL